MKDRRLLAAAVVLLLIAGLSLGPKSIGQFCRERYRRDTVLKAGSAAINIELEKTEAQREQGLSGRACIGPGQGMLFVFNDPDFYQFWMKDMKFPIDIVWIDASKKVVQVEANVSPSTYPQNFSPSQPAKYVLELKAYQAQKLGIGQGITVTF
jgi:uncharacterized membrane protein (UPF0127 family)